MLLYLSFNLNTE